MTKITSDITALILCGGKGERLRPLTEEIPKPLVPINGRPILSYLIDHIKKYNISNIVIAAGYQSNKIKGFFNNKDKELNVSIIDSGDVDIISRIKDCSSIIEGDFVVFYGDTLADVNITELQKYHYKHNSKLTMTLWPLKSQFGLVELNANQDVINFMEKPTLDQWINIGSFYFEQDVLELIEGFSSYSEFLEYMGSHKKIKGYKHQGVHITVNTLQELKDAEENIHEFE